MGKVLKLLDEKQLYAKTSKSFFGVLEVEYLGHIVSHEGVKVDPKKLKTLRIENPHNHKASSRISQVHRVLLQFY